MRKGVHNMKILIAGDGVIFNMLEAIHIRDKRFLPSKIKDMDWKTGDYGISRTKALSYRKQVETLKHQPYYRGAREGVRQLLKLGIVEGYTSVPRACKEFRMHQFQKIGISKVHFFTDCKLPLAADVVIDHDPNVLEQYRGSDTICILIDHAYNRTESSDFIIRVKNVMKAFEVIKKKTQCE